MCNTYYPTGYDIVGLLLYVFLQIIVFFAYYQEYEWEDGLDPFKDIGIALGHVTHIVAALHLLPVLRNSPLWLLLGKQNIQLSHNYVVGWHILNGWIILFFVTIHMLSFWLDWLSKGEVLLTNTSTTKTNMWVYSALNSENCWEEYGPCLGEIAWLSSVLLLLFALNPVRRACYYLFLYTHWVFFLTFFIFGGLHDPQLIYWCIPEFVLYLGDWFLRGYRVQKIKLVPYHQHNNTGNEDKIDRKIDRFTIKSVNSKFLYPGNISGKFVYLCVPSVSKREWHPFSLCAGSVKKGVADVIIRPHGTKSWTALVLKAAETNGTLQGLTSGMYGSVHSMTSSVVVFIAGGVGFTAIEPMIKHAVMSWVHMSDDRPMLLREIVIIWCVRKEEDLQWFQESLEKYMRNCNGIACTIKLTIQLFVTEKKISSSSSNSFENCGVGMGSDARGEKGVEMNSHPMVEVAGVAVGAAVGAAVQMPTRTNDTNDTRNMLPIIRRRPIIEKQLKAICSRCSEAEYIDIFVCGPSGMRQAVLKAAAASTTGPTMLVHDESFAL